MCGIAGFSLSPTSKLPVRQFAHELLLHSEERGKVASGFAFMQGGKVYSHKDAKNGGHLTLQGLPKNARVGFIHTRNATKGDPSDNENNHPLVDSSGEITLVHNGVVTNHKAIEEGIAKETSEAFAEVDSAVLPALIRMEGFRGLSNADGWAAVAWFDITAPQTLYLARTTGNAPLIVAQLKDGSVVFASTFQILHAALIRVGYGDQIRWAYEVPEHHYYQVKNGVIDVMQQFDKYLVSKAKYKGATATLSWQEKKDLEAITNGSAVSYSDPKAKAAVSAAAKTDAPPASGTTTTGKGTASTSAGATGSAKPHYQTPYATTPQVTATPVGGSYVVKADEPKKPAYNIPAGSDPLAALGGAFKPNTTETKPHASTAYQGRPAASGGAASGTKSGTTAKASGPRIGTGVKASSPLSEQEWDYVTQAVPWEIDVLMIYWVSWLEADDTMIFDYNIVNPGHNEGYVEFCETVAMMVQEGWVSDFGIVGFEGELLSFAQNKDYGQDVGEIVKHAHRMVSTGTSRIQIAIDANIYDEIVLTGATDAEMAQIMDLDDAEEAAARAAEEEDERHWQDNAPAVLFSDEVVSEDPAVVQAFLEAQAEREGNIA